MSGFEIRKFRAVCSTSWDLGGNGVLTIANVTVFISLQSFKLRGFLSLGNTVLELELTNSSDGEVFRLVNPINTLGLEALVTDALQKMIPGVKGLPDVNLLGLNINDASTIQSAEVQFSNGFDYLDSFAVTFKLSKLWSFFQSSLFTDIPYHELAC